MTGVQTCALPIYWTEEQITQACIERSYHPSWGDGDSVDREAVRDTLLETI